MTFHQAPSFCSRRHRGASEGAKCAWMATDAAIGSTRAFLVRCGGLLDDWSVDGVLSLVFMLMTSLVSTGANTFSQHNQTGLIDELLA
ncbi:hypothetical protein TNCV_3657101 [Trichonephila clavipes]|nr:hypothetical protein TNCV_3657101 [Trichonephila clavipes]